VIIYQQLRFVTIYATFVEMMALMGCPVDDITPKVT